MRDNEKIAKAFSNLKASEDVLANIYNSIDAEKNIHKKGVSLAVAIIAILCVCTGVYAAIVFRISSNFLKQEPSVEDETIKHNIEIIKKNNEKRGEENVEINGFFVSNPFGSTKETENGFYRHDGIDFIAALGTKVLSAADGVVKDAGYNSDDGYYVVIEHADGFETFYMHLQEILVEIGDKILCGDEIGKVGSTGKATGPHLHFELHKDGVAVNPVEYLTEEKE